MLDGDLSETTPMMKQYLEIKGQYRDAVLFFRLGDFYEMFEQDAIEISALLNLTLTKRGKTPMCGVPYHASRVYIARLLRFGKKIAICEQITVPGAGKGLADRQVVEVITPGTVAEEEYLDRSINNYLACLSGSRVSGNIAFAYLDLSTGEFAATSFSVSYAIDHIRRELGRVHPRELLVQQSLQHDIAGLTLIFEEYPGLLCSMYPDWSFNTDAAWSRLCTRFETGSLKAFGLEKHDPEVTAAALLVEYIEQTAGPRAAHLNSLRIYRDSEFLSLDDSTRRNLELTVNLREGTSAFTLFEVLDHTRTAPGARLLRNWILHPLVNREQLEKRLEAVDSLYRNQQLLSRIRDTLSRILDIERLTGRVAMERANGKDLGALRQSLEGFVQLASLVGESEIDSPAVELIDSASFVHTLLESSIQPDCPVVINEGGLIKPLWSTKLDELRSLQDNSNAVLEQYLFEERQGTGIQNLKIRYNRMIGYYLEVSKGNLSAVPDHFIRRRSLANGDRFTTDRLIELETQLSSVQTSIIDLEKELFLTIRSQVYDRITDLLTISALIAHIDVLQSFARAATVHGWVRPIFRDDTKVLIEQGRHPVVEAHLGTSEFIPNGLTLSAGNEDKYPWFALITGPNMAGKSTFLRQNALIVLMAQLGSFVPASRCSLGMVDKIFCRVGASDNLARGESTFLVEMTETALILRTATERSLVIMDEVGRGTSTEDGLAIASAVSEYLLNHIRCRTLFATHYHELSRLEHSGLALLCLDVLEQEGEVHFLKKVRPGASANSFGIHVAKLAGLPAPVVHRARVLLETQGRTLQVFTEGTDGKDLSEISMGEDVARASAGRAPQPGLLFSEEELVLNDLLSVNIDSITPLAALSLLDSLKRRLTGIM